LAQFLATIYVVFYIYMANKATVRVYLSFRQATYSYGAALPQ